MIYLDYNATAPVRPEVRDVMMEAMVEPTNASSVHASGRKAKQQLQEARQVVGDAVSAWANEVIFMGSGSEANNMALRGFADRPLLVGATEHASIIKTAEKLGGDTLPVNQDGIIDLQVLEAKLKSLGKPALVSVMLVNNETGVIQPIAEIRKIVKAYDGLLHCDAVQALGKMSVDINLLGVDMLTLCAHKFGGPIGVGALVIRNDLAIKPMIHGGGQELNRRAGTENLPAILGFAKALELSNDWLKNVSSWLGAMEADIKAFAPDAIIVGEGAKRVGNTSNIIMPAVSSETQLMTYDLEGMCVSAGSACSSGRIEASHVLTAMGYDASAGCAIRVSAGWDTKEEDIKAFTSLWKKTYERLAQKAA